MTIYSLDVFLFLFGTSLLFHVWSQCCFLTCKQISQEAGKVVWYSHLFQNFPQFIVIHTVKGFGIVHTEEIDVFLERSCFSNDPADVNNLSVVSLTFLFYYFVVVVVVGYIGFIVWFFFKTSLNIWKFTVHKLLKPGLENFEHYFMLTLVCEMSIVLR